MSRTGCGPASPVSASFSLTSIGSGTAVIQRDRARPSRATRRTPRCSCRTSAPRRIAVCNVEVMRSCCSIGTRIVFIRVPSKRCSLVRRHCLIASPGVLLESSPPGCLRQSGQRPRSAATSARRAKQTCTCRKCRRRSARPPPSGPQPGRWVLGHGEIRTIVLGLMLAMFLAALNQTIVATALPTIGRDFGDFDLLPWVVTVLSADLHRGLAALRQAQRHPRAARHDARKHRDFHRRLRRLRCCARHDQPHSRPRPAGDRRRRHSSAGANHPRRCCRAARTRPLPGLHGKRLGDVRASPVRCSAACWPSISTGRSSSGSMFRWDWWRRR